MHEAPGSKDGPDSVAGKSSESMATVEYAITDLGQIIPKIDLKNLHQSKPGLFVTDQAPEHFKTSDFAFSAHMLRNFFNTSELDGDEKWEPAPRDAMRQQRIAEVAKFLRGKVVVDFGAGSKANAYKIAWLCDAKAYVGIEPVYFDNLWRALVQQKASKIFSDLQNKTPIPFAVVAEDITDFLKRLPDNAVCIFTFGIDSLILPIGSGERAFLVKQFARVLHPQGAYLSDTRSIFQGGGLDLVSTQNLRPGDRDFDRDYRLYTKPLSSEESS